MTPTLQLHIGASKTGTTYLQSALHANSGRLRDRGVLVPDPHLDHSRLAAWALDSQHALPRPKEVDRGARRVLATVREWLAEGPGRTAVISHELFAAATEEQIGRVLAQLPETDVTVHYTVRALSRTLPAEWQQAVKGGNAMTLAEFTSGILGHFGSPLSEQPLVFAECDIVPKFTALHDVPQVLPRWAAAIGADNVRVVTVPQGGRDPDALWRRFLASLEIDATGLPVPEGTRPNVSLGAVEAETLRRVNAAVHDLVGDPGHQTKRALRRLALSHLVGRAGQRPIGISEEAHAWARQQSRRIVTYLEAAGHPVQGSLDDLLVPEPWTAVVLPEDQDDSAIAEAAASAVAALLLDRVAQDPQSAP